MNVAVYQGNTRVQTFDLQTSSDGTNFTTVAAGLKSSGTTTALETYNLPAPASARFVRLLCHGSNVSNWNSLTEVQIWGSTITPPNLLPPTNLTASLVTSTSATISWTASTSPGVTGYNVEVIPSGSVVTPGVTPAANPNPVTGTTTSFTNLTPNTSYNVFVYAIDGLGHSSVAATATFTTLALINRILTGSSGDGWHALAISPAASGLFVASFDATPTVSPENTVVGLSSGAATAYGNLSCIVRFNPSGQIDAYNGTGYAAAASINYSAGVTYHFRIAVDVTAHTYSVYVTVPGSLEQLLGSNYAFRSTANTVTSLDTWNLDLNAAPSGCSLTAINLTP